MRLSAFPNLPYQTLTPKPIIVTINRPPSDSRIVNIWPSPFWYIKRNSRTAPLSGSLQNPYVLKLITQPDLQSPRITGGLARHFSKLG